MNTTTHVDDILVNYGSELKKIEEKENEFIACAVVFGDENNTDVSKEKDYFQKDTYFGIEHIKSMPVYYHHGLDQKYDNRIIGKAVVEDIDDVGVWAKVQLDIENKYDEYILAKINEQKMGVSTGVAAHMVRRNKKSNGSNKITHWPLGADFSLTLSPAEPKTRHLIRSIKNIALESLNNSFADSFEFVNDSMKTLTDSIIKRHSIRKSQGRKLSESDSKIISSYVNHMKEAISKLEECWESQLSSTKNNPDVKQTDSTISISQEKVNMRIRQLKLSFDSLVHTSGVS